MGYSLKEVAPSIARSEQIGTALFPFYMLVLMGYSLKEVHVAEWCMSWVLIHSQLNLVCRCSNFVWLTDCVSNVDVGSSISNFSTWEAFLAFWVPLGVSIMTLLPVLLTIWDYIGLNGVENLSFCLSLALDHQIEYQIVWCF